MPRCKAPETGESKRSEDKSRGSLIMMKSFHDVIRQISDLADPVLQEMAFELVDVEFLSKYGRWVLRLYIDKEGGVTVDDCARVSGEIGNLIDAKDIIPHHYVLEVSSPGLDRPLKKERDLIRSIGKKVKLKTNHPIGNRSNFTGYLKDFREGMIFLEMDGGLLQLPWEEIEKANMIYEF